MEGFVSTINFVRYIYGPICERDLWQLDEKAIDINDKKVLISLVVTNFAFPRAIPQCSDFILYSLMRYLIFPMHVILVVRVTVDLV